MHVLFLLKVRLNAEPANGATPLHAAAEQGFAACAHALLRGGADPEDRSMGGLAPLHSAAMHGRREVRACMS